MNLADRIKRFVFKYIDSNMYILVEDGEALVIDPHISTEAENYLNDNGVSKVTIILTHEHFDHICGVNWFRQNYDTYVICQENALDERRQHFCGDPRVISVVLADRGELKKIDELNKEYQTQLYRADYTFEEKKVFEWKSHDICLEHAPGHSPASILITIDERYVFTGDSLIPGAEPTLRWPWSNAKQYDKITLEKLLKLEKNCLILPGHREPINIGRIEWKDNMFKIK